MAVRMAGPFGRTRRGFTLAELSVSVVIVSVVMVALGSAVVLLSRSAPRTASAAAVIGNAASAVDQIAAELQYATRVTEATATAVTFQVADRNKDSQPETIRYAWSGTKGDPITREYNNSGNKVTVAPDVGAFALAYTKRKVSTSKDVTSTNESGEMLFADFSGWAVLPSLRELQATASQWIAEAFTVNKVSFPASTTGVSITKIRIQARKPASGAPSFTVAVHKPVSAGSAQPASSPIGTPTTVLVSSLPASQAWVDVPFTDVTVAGPETDFVIVIKGIGGATAIVRYLNAVLAPADSTIMRWTTDSGSSWAPSVSLLAQNDVIFEAYGKYTTSSTSTQTTDDYFLRTATVAIEPASSASRRAETTARAHNEPKIPGP